jgi:multidrug transporter EmrE-like cation transporter
MPAWSVPALFAAACIAAHYLTLRAASGRIGDALGALVLEGSAALGILVLLATRAAPTAPTTASGVAWSCASGLCISGATTLLFTSLRLGGPVSATGPLVLGGGVALAALVAPAFFAEPFTLRRALGVAFALVAMALLATEGSSLK